MPQNQNEWAKCARLRLIQQLGGKCAQCGSVERLEINHIQGTEKDLSRMSPSARVCLYRKEAKQGKLNVLCRACNLRYRPKKTKTEEPF